MMYALGLLLYVIVASAKLTSTQTVLNFCSGRSVNGAFSSVRSADLLGGSGPLYLEGSDSAINSVVSSALGTVACTCTVRNGGADIPKMLIAHYADGLYRTCGKSIELHTGRKVIHRFGCAGSEFELLDIVEEGIVTLTLYVTTPRPSDSVYKLLLQPDRVTAQLYVTCLPPVLPKTTSSSTTSSTSSSSSTTSTVTSSVSTTSSLPTTSPSSTSDKVVLVGIVTSVMVTVFVILGCFLCYLLIKRRNKKKKEKSTDGKDVEKQGATEANQDKPLHEYVHNTVSHIYASIRSNVVMTGIRKKASLPKNPLDRLRGRTKRDGALSVKHGAGNTASGLYDSIKSNRGYELNENVREITNGQVDNLPMTGVDKLALTRHDSCESDHYIHAMPNEDPKPVVTAQMSTESSKYITPVIVNTLPARSDDAVVETGLVRGTSVSENVAFETEDYLEPIHSGVDTERLANIEDPYTIMKTNARLNENSDCYMTCSPRYREGIIKGVNPKPEINRRDIGNVKEESDSYITGRPRYVASQNEAISEETGSETISKQNEDNKNESVLSDTSQRGSSDLNMDKVHALRKPVSVQPSGTYIPMDSTKKYVACRAHDDHGYFSMNRGEISTLESVNSQDNVKSGLRVPDNDLRDSGYDEPIKYKNFDDNNEIKSENNCSVTEAKYVNDSSELFNLADIELGLPVENNVQKDKQNENTSKPKVKRYVRNTEK